MVYPYKHVKPTRSLRPDWEQAKRAALNWPANAVLGWPDLGEMMIEQLPQAFPGIGQAFEMGKMFMPKWMQRPGEAARKWAAKNVPELYKETTGPEALAVDLLNPLALAGRGLPAVARTAREKLPEMVSRGLRKVGPLQAMSPQYAIPHSELVHAIKESGIPGLSSTDIVEVYRNIGKRFFEAAKDPKTGFFASGREPAKTPEEAIKKYGLSRLTQEISPFGDVSYEAFVPQSGSSAIMHMLNRKDLLAAYDPNLLPTGIKPFTQYLPKRGKYYQIGTAEFSPGTGAGKTVYPAFYDMVMADPWGYNITDVLTPVNTYRRNINLADAILRHGEPGARRLLINPNQLKAEGTFDVSTDPLDFWMKRTPEEKVGEMLGLAALGTERRLGYGVEPKAMEKFLQMGATADPQEFARLRSEFPIKEVGTGALQRAAIANAIFEGKPVNPELFRGLAKKKGGRV